MNDIVVVTTTQQEQAFLGLLGYSTRTRGEENRTYLNYPGIVPLLILALLPPSSTLQDK